MKHNKSRNVGILFESLIHNSVIKVSNNQIDEASKLIKLVKKYFLENTEVSKMYKVYSQLLYTSSRNHFYASRFYDSLIREYNSLNLTKAEAELSKLHRDIEKDFSLKEIMNVRIPNYKLFASFKIMAEQDSQYLTSKEKMDCDYVILEHLVDNKELKRLQEASIDINPKDQFDVDTDNVAFAIAMKEFHKEYGTKLIDEQKEFLVKYYSSPPTTFNNWAMKKVDGMIDEVTTSLLKVEDKDVNKKLQLVGMKLEKIKELNEINSNNFVDVLVTIDLCNKLKNI